MEYSPLLARTLSRIEQNGNKFFTQGCSPESQGPPNKQFLSSNRHVGKGQGIRELGNRRSSWNIP